MVHHHKNQFSSIKILVLIFQLNQVNSTKLTLHEHKIKSLILKAYKNCVMEAYEIVI